MPKISVTSVLLALNVAIFGLMLAWGVDPMQPSIPKPDPMGRQLRA